MVNDIVTWRFASMIEHLKLYILKSVEEKLSDVAGKSEYAKSVAYRDTSARGCGSRDFGDRINKAKP